MTIKRLIVLVATVLTVLIVALVMLQKEDMRKYAEAFVTAYDGEIGFYFPRHRNQFPFYSNGSYAISACVSKTHGAAVLFNPSDDWLYQFETTGERVEKTIFGGNWSTWAAFTFPPADPSEGINITRLVFGGSVETSGHPLVEMQGNASGIFQNITVNSVHYHCVILKGSNETMFWTTEAAKNDAEFLFKHDLGIALSQSEEIRMRYAEPELTTLVQNLVIDKLTNKTLGYSYLEMEEDIEFIEKLAEYKYGISEPNANSFIRNIRDFLSAKIALQEKKTIFGFRVDDPSNWLYVGAWCVYPPLTFALYLTVVYLSKKAPRLREFKGWGKFTFGAVLGGGLSSLLFNPPYDYQILSIQTLTIIIVLTLGTAIVHAIHSYLRRRF